MPTFTQLQNRLRKYNLWIALFISSWLLPIITNLFSTWLQQRFGPTQNTLIQLCAVGFVGLIGLWIFYQVLSKEEPKNVVTKDMQPAPYPGLIVLIGPGRADANPQKLAHTVAIDYHLQPAANNLNAKRLQVCWLIATAGPQGSVDLAQKVQAQYAAQGVKMLLHLLKDAFDVQEAYECVQQIYTDEVAQHNLKPEEVISDFTGGTKPMSAGMILACQDQWPLQYVHGRPGEILSAPVAIAFQSKKRRQKK